MKKWLVHALLTCLIVAQYCAMFLGVVGVFGGILYIACRYAEKAVLVGILFVTILVFLFGIASMFKEASRNAYQRWGK